MKKTITIITISIILITNLPFWSFVTLRNYSYTNADHTYSDTEMSGMGGDFEVVKLGFQRFRQQHSQQTDQQLYRTFTIQPWRFWEWREMLFHSERFRLPYQAP